jgi:hypothetical protein
MANNPQRDDKRQSGDKSDQSQTKRPGHEQRKSDMTPQRTPNDQRRGSGQDDGMKPPNDKREVAKR